MRFTLHSNKNTEKTRSPITGNEMELSVRAYCGNCGCLVSHKSIEAVEKAIANSCGCKKCGCLEITVKYTALEDVKVGHGDDK